MSRLVVRLTVAVLAAATVGLGASEPAQAATCASAHGVSVVVDFHQLGGGVQTRCDGAGAGEVAWDQLQDVGFKLTPVNGEAFVCRIDGKPSSDQESCQRTPPADAYWSLWWTDGKTGKWSFSSQGAGSLKVPEGGSVAMSWQSGNDQVPPGAPAPRHETQPSPSPTSRPSASPQPSSSPPSQVPSSSAAPGASSPTSSAADARSGRTRAGGHGKHQHTQPSKRAKAKASAHAPDRTEAAAPLAGVAPTGSTESDSSGSGGLPGWVAPIAVAVLFVGSGAVVLARRRRSGGA
ncbi:MAG TPA: hypothetical protein VGK78_15725 [Nocardioides sp.]|uniref:hypothetical protein n=1 Tax=Nocardioides sp. TaxID=35761 RepID=UPI002F3F0A44